MNFEERWTQIKEFIINKKTAIDFEGNEIDYFRCSEPVGNMSIFVNMSIGQSELISQSMITPNKANCVIYILAANQKDYYECAKKVQRTAIKLIKELSLANETLGIVSVVRAADPDQLYADRSEISLYFSVTFQDY